MLNEFEPANLVTAHMISYKNLIYSLLIVLIVSKSQRAYNYQSFNSKCRYDKSS